MSLEKLKHACQKFINNSYGFIKRTIAKTGQLISKIWEFTKGLLFLSDGSIYWTLLKISAFVLTIFICVLIYLNFLVFNKFETRRWSTSAKVYSKPIELYMGMEFNSKLLIGQLERQGYRAASEVTKTSGTYKQSADKLTVHIRDFQFHDGYQKSKIVEIEFVNNQIEALTDKNGKDLHTVRLDPQIMGGIYPASYEDRILIKLSDVPPFIIDALIATEDRDFYSHFGISPRGIMRAMFANIKAGGIVQGGSTLTQQLVKNFFLHNKRTLSRKIAEVLMAILIEIRYEKEDILEAYINEVYLGQQGKRSIHGFELASYFYFARPLKELNMAQQALLVAMIKGPSLYNPRRYKELTLARRNLVLDLVSETGKVSKQKIAEAKKSKLEIVSEKKLKSNEFPAYIDLVKRQLKRDYKEQDLTSRGLRIFTHMDPIQQQQAQDSVINTLKHLEKNKKKANTDKPLQASLVVTNPHNGHVLAIIGDRDPSYAGFNRALDATRPIGSLIKPAVYLTALSQSTNYSLATLIKDEPVSIPVGHNNVWEPQNFDLQYHGDVSLLRALSHSYNLATVNLGMSLGVKNVITTLKKMGLKTKVNPYPSLFLGAANLSPLEVTSMYQTLASGGYKHPLQTINYVLDKNGIPLQKYTLKSKRVFSPQLMAVLQYAMSVTMREGTGRRAYWFISPNITLAGKTGTSDDQRDSWFAGFSKNLLAVVWVGYDDNTPSKFTGSSGALTLWTDFMKQNTLVSLPVENPVDNIVYHWIDETTGLLGNQTCDNIRLMPFVSGSEPNEWSPCIGPAQQSILNWFQRITQQSTNPHNTE